WEQEWFDRLIRSERDLHEKFHYIMRNPWDSGVAGANQDYRWVWSPRVELGALQSAEIPGSAGCQPAVSGSLPDASLGVAEREVKSTAVRDFAADCRVAQATSPCPPERALPRDAPQIIIGTHALLYEKVSFSNLGLVVIDEQHKFGVAQRARLTTREPAPDVLVMTATPIPRTLTMTV